MLAGRLLAHHLDGVGPLFFSPGALCFSYDYRRSIFRSCITRGSFLPAVTCGIVGEGYGTGGYTPHRLLCRRRQHRLRVRTMSSRLNFSLSAVLSC